MRIESRRVLARLLVACAVVARAPEAVTAQTPGAQASSAHQHDAAPSTAAAQRLGTVRFPTSAPADAQAKFIEGLLYLHSFEYESARSAFREAERRAPGFALAYWGEAQTLNHPVWNQQQADSAHAVLARLGATPAARVSKAPTARETAWLETVETLYGEGSKPRRDTLYLHAMTRLAAAYPADDEAQAFLALAWLGLNQGTRRVSDYMRAGAIASPVFVRSPDHPGAAHYVIHSFDDPEHAVLGLPAARAYSRIAPGAAHAQHMTTHIFLALGMWPESNAQNRIALDAVNGVSGHYGEWLVYGFVQEGRFREARALLDTLSTRAAAGRRGLAMALPGMRAAIAVATGNWTAAEHSGSSSARVPVDDTSIISRWFRAIAAARRGDADRAGAALALLRALRDSVVATPAATASERGVTAAFVRSVESASLAARGDTAAAVGALRAAQATLDSLPAEFGPPAMPLLVGEQLTELLLASARPADAQRVIQETLRQQPGRSTALALLVRAAVANGDVAVAEDARATLARNWALADDGGATLRALPGRRAAAK